MRLKDKENLLVGVVMGSFLPTPQKTELIGIIREAADNDRWIPVTERLPDKEFWEHQKRFEDDDLEVLVMIKGAKLPTTLCYNAEGDFYAMTEDGITFYLVTHWKPLPKPPKEG